MTRFAIFTGALCWIFSVASAADLVEDGQPRAVIVTAPDAPRMVQLAAAELQEYVAKISGAELPIAHQPDRDYPQTIFVGRSEFTDMLGITANGLEAGAYRIASGEDWLVLLGHDEDYELPEIHTLQPSADHPDSVEMQRQWDEATGGTYWNPIGGPGLRRLFNRDLGIWIYDQRGSLNAVYGFLRDLGVRWYMPGELGEIVPQMSSIPLPIIDAVVVPEFAHRQAAFATFSTSPAEEVLWYLRMGFTGDEAVGHYSHGLRDIMRRPEMEAAHPEYYALIRGQRHLGKEQKNMPCLSSKGLEAEAVQFARAMFDVYDVPMVSMMPQDGFLFCADDLCAGLDAPERGREGMHSDYVWGFVDRVAREVYKTHPDKLINCLAYGTYFLPPENIDKLSPNVVVGFIHGRRNFDDPATRKEVEALRQEWRKLTDQPFWNWEHYPFTHRSTITPDYFPRSIAEGIRSMRGEFLGEFIEVAWGPAAVRGHGLHEPGFNHLNVYVTARYQWDADADLDALLDEYYDLFYGPAAAEMQAFIEFSEANRAELRRNAEVMTTALELIDAAESKVDPDSPYGKRVAMVVDYLDGLRQLRDRIAAGRVDVPEAQAAVVDAPAVTMDGNLDDAAWQGLPRYPLVDVKTGDTPKTGTWFKVLWDGTDREGSLYIGIHCDEPDMENLRILAEKSGDWRVLDGDAVEVLLETQAHSYYQLAVDAVGNLVDLDRNHGKLNHAWSSLAETAGHSGDGYWSVEIRIPVTGEETPGDPLHEIAGWRPTDDAPWHINVCRQRVRGEDREWTAWSPTGGGFHDVMRFGRLGGVQ